MIDLLKARDVPGRGPGVSILYRGFLLMTQDAVIEDMELVHDVQAKGAEFRRTQNGKR